MPYTNVWSSVTPANTDPATPAADIRKLRLDIAERMTSILGAGGWLLDPIAPFSGINSMYIPWSQFQVYSGSGSWVHGVAQLWGAAPNNAVTFTLYCPLLLPRGVTVTEMEILGQTGTSSTLTLTLENINATTGTVTQAVLATTTMVASTTQVARTGGTISVALDSNVANRIFYYLKLVVVCGSAANVWYQGVRLKYTRASLGQSV